MASTRATRSTTSTGRIALDVEWNAKDLAADLIRLAKVQAEDGDRARLGVLRKLAEDPLGSTTTTNLEKLTPRMGRGDAGGCPLLAIAITERCFVPPEDIATAVADAASTVGAGNQDDPDADDLGPRGC